MIDIKENSRMVYFMVRVLSISTMIADTKENGKMVSNKGKVSIITP